MAKLELTDTEADMLCDILHIEKEAWEDELDRILADESFDSWEALLQSTGHAGAAITLLEKIGRQLIQNG